MKSDEKIIEMLRARVNFSEPTERMMLAAIDLKNNEWKEEMEQLQKDLLYNLINIPTLELKDTITKTFYKRFGL